ncbi:MAG: hypothetical protein JWQ38_2021, partial [Flavipsychrobacter sp.]|nr:hypothetical protein [Flavipsychrobacter sp.]
AQRPAFSAGGVGVCGVMLLFSFYSVAQDGKASAKMDAAQIMVGDQVRLFLEAQHDPTQSRLQWAVVPDTFNNLEVVERGKIDTMKQGSMVTYRQRITLTGFDSGLFKVPSFPIAIIPNTGTPYTAMTDSFNLLVQTVAVDTTKGFKGIKGIIYVQSNWRDYIWYIVGGAAILLAAIILTIYFVRRKKEPKPVQEGPQETLQEKTLRQLTELEAKQLWQKKQVKEYYVELTDIVRSYIEQRFNTPAMELTTDELLYKAQLLKEMQPYHSPLSIILQTADLAKFAKAQPLPEEHVGAMDMAKQFVATSKPVIIIETPTEKTI